MTSRAGAGGVAVLIGLVVLATTSYLVLALAGRSLGPTNFAGVSALYVLLSAVGTGLFLPAEQEVARLWTIERAADRDPVAVAVQVASLALAVGAVAAVLFGTALRHFALRLLGGNDQLLAAFLIGLLGYAVCFTLRGVFAGEAALRRYGAQLAVEGGSRLIAVIPLAATGADTAWFGWAIGLSPWVAAIATLPLSKLRRPNARSLPWLPLIRAIGFLIVAIGASQVLINAGPVVIGDLSSVADRPAAGGFLAALVVVRIPVFLFTAVAPSFLPALTGHVGGGRFAAFWSLVRRITVAVVGFSVLMTLVLVAIGPAVLRGAFGFSTGIDRVDFGLLSLASGLFLLASLWAQSLLAAGRHRATVAGWLAGLLALGVATAGSGTAVQRAERGFLIGAAVAATVQAIMLFLGTRVATRPVTVHPPGA